MEVSRLYEVENRLSALYEIKKLVAVEIYKLCFRCGLDPDIFNYSSFTASMYYPVPAFPGELERRCKQMIAVVKKIEELENA